MTDQYNRAYDVAGTLSDACIEWLSQEGNYDKLLEFGNTSPQIADEIMNIVKSVCTEDRYIEPEEVIFKLRTVIREFKEFVSYMKTIVDDSKSNVYFQDVIKRLKPIQSPISDTMLSWFRIND